MNYETMYCRNCYRKIPASSKICPECGEIFAKDDFGAEPFEPLINNYGNYKEDETEQTTLLMNDEPISNDGYAWDKEFDDRTSILKETPSHGDGVYNKMDNSENTNYAAEKMTTNSETQDKMSYLDFYNKYTSNTTRNWVNAAYVVAFISAGLFAVLMILVGGSLVTIFDIAFYAVFGVLLLKSKEYKYSLILMVYAIIATALVLFSGGGLKGLPALICLIMSTSKLSKVNDAYKNYMNNGVIPEQSI